MFKFKPGFKITNDVYSYDVIEDGKVRWNESNGAVYNVKDLLALESEGPWYCVIDDTKYYIPTDKECKIIDLIRDENDKVKTYVQGLSIAEVMDYEIVNYDGILQACKPDEVSLDEDDFKFLVDYDGEYASESDERRLSELKAMFRGR